jgi:hypothetical protein
LVKGLCSASRGAGGEQGGLDAAALGALLTALVVVPHNS